MVLLANLHGDGSCKASTRAQMCHALETARRNARTLVVIGDFNLTPEEGAVSETLAKGWLELPETQQERQQPTRTHGRHIDYMLISRGKGVTGRKQIEGVADHDMVMYDLAVGDALRKFGYQARSHITRREAEVTKDEWEQHWSSYADVFNRWYVGLPLRCHRRLFAGGGIQRIAPELRTQDPGDHWCQERRAEQLHNASAEIAQTSETVDFKGA